MDIPVGNIITAIATVISVVVANRVSSSQTGRAKLWDVRRHAYGVIISELASVEHVCDIVDEYMQESVERYYQSEIHDKHNAWINERMEIVRQKFSDDYLILSKEFVALFEAFVAALSAGSDDDLFPEDHERFSGGVRKYRPLLLAQGRAEIDLSAEPWGRLKALVWSKCR